MLTDEETADMHRMVTEMEDRGLACDLFTLARLAEATGDAWEKLVRECITGWRLMWPPQSEKAKP